MKDIATDANIDPTGIVRAPSDLEHVFGLFKNVEKTIEDKSDDLSKHIQPLTTAAKNDMATSDKLQGELAELIKRKQRFEQNTDSLVSLTQTIIDLTQITNNRRNELSTYDEIRGKLKQMIDTLRSDKMTVYNVITGSTTITITEAALDLKRLVSSTDKLDRYPTQAQFIG